jgi:hypothetical protein
MCCAFPQDFPSQREQVHDRNEVLYFKVLSEHPPDHEGDLLAEFRQIAHRCPARRKHGGCQCHVKAPPASRYAGRESRCPPCLVSGHFQPGASGVDGVSGRQEPATDRGFDDILAEQGRRNSHAVVARRHSVSVSEIERRAHDAVGVDAVVAVDVVE